MADSILKVKILKGNFSNLPEKVPSEIRIFLSSSFSGFININHVIL